MGSGGPMFAGLCIVLAIVVVVVIYVFYVVVSVALWVSMVSDMLVVGYRSLPRGLRVSTLGGVTTLERNLSDLCGMCRGTMEAGEKVRTLSCNQVFHCGDSEKYQGNIDKWFLVAPRMVCPIFDRIPHPVLPWRAPPAPHRQGWGEMPPLQSSSGLEKVPPPAGVVVRVGGDSTTAVVVGVEGATTAVIAVDIRDRALME
ncbi:hypothetical protein GQ55_7G191600 [Panicum hallii var. hallii]|uniref:RING-type domain-containing protein n=1 Tax=Panicum hallii var. hallii TaxID=1504633 RepID=A0A2T7CWP1_9POAL|nr:hypothetical protein GQ55_7G191600 [Panicum hallii var. hallii]